MHKIQAIYMNIIHKNQICLLPKYQGIKFIILRKDEGLHIPCALSLPVVRIKLYNRPTCTTSQASRTYLQDKIFDNIFTKTALVYRVSTGGIAVEWGERRCAREV